MHLFTLKAGEAHASAFAESLRRLGIRDGQPADLPDGREWLLNVTITRNPVLLSEEMFQSAE